MGKRIIAVIILIAAVFMLSACFGQKETSVAQLDVPQRLTVSAESIELNKTSMKVYIGEPAKLEATLLPRETTDIPSYSSSDESVVSVDKHGNLEVLAEGTAEITVTVGALKATCRVTAAYPPIDSIAFTAQEETLKFGEKLETQITLHPENAQPEEFVYSSDDERIATVDENGIVTAVGVGNTCIYAALKSDDSIRCMLGLTTTCDQIEKLEFEEPYYSLLADGQRTLPLMTEPFGMLVKDVVWASSDESVVTVDQDGMVTAHSRGNATITASADGRQAECIVAVVKRLAPDPLSEIEKGRYTDNGGILESETSDGSGEAKLMLIGDLMCLSAQQNAARSNGVHNFNSSFGIVKDIFAESDFCIGNMETLVSYSASYASEAKEVNGNPNCNAPATYLDALKHAGMDALILANNHCTDGGETGIYETLQQLYKYKIPSTGMFASADDQRFMIADVNGIKVGIAAYTGHFNGGGRTVTGDRRDIMLNLYSKEKAEADIAAMKEAGAEYIIVYAHWGKENTHKVNGAQKQVAQELADAGADLIAGSHPHCLQPAEMLTAADGREVFCIYSLGNFVSSMGRTINNDTIILNADIRREGDKIVLADIGYIGCRVIGSYDGGRHVVVPTSAALNGGDTSSALQSAQQRIAKVMDGTLLEITELGG